jgi:hypothetical protein
MSVQAGNGEPVDAEGLYRPATCNFDFTIDCDDRFAGSVASCHMRGQEGDEGLAIKGCINGRVTVGVAAGSFLERAVTVRAEDFGEVFCGKESNVNFCVICDTFTTTAGARKCVKIINNNQTSAPDTCGAFSVVNGSTNACSSETNQAKGSFSDPHIGFFVNMNGSDADEPEAKQLVLCQRSWQCINNPSDPLLPSAIDAKLQGPEGHGLIDTPCCMRLASGAYYCSAALKPSSTCR